MDLEGQWSDLPDHIIINILSYLSLADRCSAALTCKSWSECFDDQTLWRRFTFHFKTEEDSNQLQCLAKHGRQLRMVTIYLNQQELVNRQNACEVLTGLARCDERRLEEISVTFTMENPLFFQGLEFLSSLAELFGPPDPRAKMVATLTKVDLSGLSVTYRDVLLYLLADNHPTLQELNLQNTSLMCFISPECMHTVVKKCPKINSLSIHYRSASEELFTEFSSSMRLPLYYLSLACNREEKYHKVIPAESWTSLVSRHKRLRVCLKFDHTIERHRILTILDPQIPLVELHMRTMTELQDEVSTVARYYHSTLEYLAIVTKGTEELKRALLDVVKHSQRLHTLHCYCALDEETIDKIHTLRPQLKKYTLKTAEEFNSLVPTLVGHSARSAVM
ncbi:F-box/LRR-repeat protein 8-like isoform X2 [Acanthaster planci]|uniref:F-box/LRR-repeat protein 8-like isoform X2 n=1 Tax=Acanthaster planci TaxID=133434 RepID=A0A8B7YG16_ACAPL|nr:F-box/LRR-repeat protein 8-like isoform X2 [Acanthaster planci]